MHNFLRENNRNKLKKSRKSMNFTNKTNRLLMLAVCSHFKIAQRTNHRNCIVLFNSSQKVILCKGNRHNKSWVIET